MNGYYDFWNIMSPYRFQLALQESAAYLCAISFPCQFLSLDTILK